MWWKLILLLTVVPAVELGLLLQLGSMMGALNTFMLICVTGIVGSYMAKREGLGVLDALRRETATGLPAGSRLAEGALVLAGGLLLMTPGILTDLAGFAMIFPYTRRAIAPRLVNAVLARVDVASFGPQPDPSQRRARPEATPHAPFANPFDDLP